MEIAEYQIRQRLWNDADTVRWLDGQLEQLEHGLVTPFAVAHQLRARSDKLLTH